MVDCAHNPDSRYSYGPDSCPVPTTCAAAHLGIPTRAVRQLIHTGQLRAVRWPGRWRIPVAELERYEQQHRKAAA